MEIKKPRIRALRPVDVAKVHSEVKAALRLATLGLDFAMNFGFKAGQGALREKSDLTQLTRKNKPKKRCPFFKKVTFLSWRTR
jgi:hypothetical protein